MSRDEVLKIILASKVIAVIRMPDTEKLARVVEAVRRGGVRAIEITMTTPSALEIITDQVRSKPPGTLIGAGTVLDGPPAPFRRLRSWPPGREGWTWSRSFRRPRSGRSTSRISKVLFRKSV